MNLFCKSSLCVSIYILHGVPTVFEMRMCDFFWFLINSDCIELYYRKIIKSRKNNNRNVLWLVLYLLLCCPFLFLRLYNVMQYIVVCQLPYLWLFLFCWHWEFSSLLYGCFLGMLVNFAKWFNLRLFFLFLQLVEASLSWMMILQGISCHLTTLRTTHRTLIASRS